MSSYNLRVILMVLFILMESSMNLKFLLRTHLSSSFISDVPPNLFLHLLRRRELIYCRSSTEAPAKPRRTAEDTTGATLKPFICILLHKEICYHKVITRRLAINMKSVQDTMMLAMLRKKGGGGVVKLNKRVTDAHVQKEKGRKRTTTSALLDAAARQGGVNIFLWSPSPLRFLVCFLLWPGLKVTEVGSSASGAGSPPGCLLCYNLI